MSNMLVFITFQRYRSDMHPLKLSVVTIFQNLSLSYYPYKTGALGHYRNKLLLLQMVHLPAVNEED